MGTGEICVRKRDGVSDFERWIGRSIGKADPSLRLPHERQIVHGPQAAPLRMTLTVVTREGSRKWISYQISESGHFRLCSGQALGHTAGEEQLQIPRLRSE